MPAPAPVQQVYPAPNRNQFAAEGSYLVACNPTIGTGFTWVDSGAAAMQSFTDTAPNFWIHNNEPYGGRTIYLDYLKLVSTKVGASGVSVQYAVLLDSIPRTITTNNMTAVVPSVPSSGLSPLAIPSILVQNSATASAFSASSAAKKIAARGCVGGINIVAHTYGLTFGSLHAGSTAVGAADGTGAPGQCWDSAAAVGINPGQDCSIYFWCPTAADNLDPEFMIGMVARP
jgi:hypothetical protein